MPLSNGWRKTGSTEQSTPLEQIHFYINGDNHLRLEQAEEQLQKPHEQEVMVDVNLLVTSKAMAA